MFLFLPVLNFLHHKTPCQPCPIHAAHIKAMSGIFGNKKSGCPRWTIQIVKIRLLYTWRCRHLPKAYSTRAMKSKPTQGTDTFLALCVYQVLFLIMANFQKPSRMTPGQYSLISAYSDFSDLHKIIHYFMLEKISLYSQHGHQFLRHQTSRLCIFILCSWHQVVPFLFFWMNNSSYCIPFVTYYVHGGAVNCFAIPASSTKYSWIISNSKIAGQFNGSDLLVFDSDGDSNRQNVVGRLSNRDTGLYNHKILH